MKKQVVVLAVTVALLSGCKKDSEDASKDVNRFMKSALAYEQQGQYRAAILEAKNALQKDPKNIEAATLIAKIYNEIGVYPSTMKMLEGKEKASSEAALELAEAFVMSGKYRSAINLLTEEGLKVDGIEKNKFLAKASTRLGDSQGYESAREALVKLGATPDDIALIEADHLVSLGKNEEALAALNALSEGAKSNVHSLIMLGSIALQANSLSDSEKYFTEALSKIPNTDIISVEKTTVLSQLTEVLIRQGRTGEAYRYQNLLASANPDSKAAQEKFNDAMELYRQGKYQEAQKLLDELREQYPQDKNSAILLGMVQFQQGMDSQATQMFDKYMDLETSNSSLIQAAAIAKFRSNKIDEALVMLKKAVENQPNNAEVIATYGLALLDKDPKSSEGEKLVEKALALNPKQQRLRLALAKRYMSLEQPEQALAQLNKAYTFNKQDAVVQQALLQFLNARGEDEKVKTLIAEFKKEFPENAKGIMLEGAYLLSKKNYTAAITAFEKAISMKGNAEKHVAYAGIAQTYANKGEPQRAITNWELAITERPETLAFYAPYLFQLQTLGRANDAIPFLKGLTDKNKIWQPSMVLGQLYAFQKDTENASAAVDASLASANGADPAIRAAAAVYYALGNVKKEQKQLPEAKAFYLKATKLQPQNVNYLISLVDIEISSKNFKESQSLLDQVEKTTANEGVRAFLQGRIFAAQDKYEEAIKSFKAAWKLDANDMVGGAVYDLYSSQNKKAEALAFAKEWLEKNPKSQRATLILAVDAQETKNVDASVALYEKSLTSTPKSPLLLNNLAWMYFEKGDARALETAKKAYDLAPQVPEIMDTYGWILFKAGKREEGMIYIGKAAKAAPNNADIQAHYKEISGAK